MSQSYKTGIEDIESSNMQGGAATSYLQQKAADIRLTRVNWQSYLQGQMISPEQYNYIVKYDNASNAESRDKLIKENPDLSAKIFIDLLSRIAKEQTLQYILTMVDDMLQEDKMRVDIFREYLQKIKEPLWPHFFGFLQRGDPFMMHQSSRIIAKLACWSSQLMERNDLLFYLSFLRDQLDVPDNDYMQTVARCLQMMLRIRPYREEFVAHDGIQTIKNALSGKLSAQIQYQLIFCLWCLSFDEDLVHAIMKHNIIPNIADILCETAKEKVVRISCALFRHIIEKLSEPSQVQECALSMVQCKVLKQLELLLQKNYEHDPELADDLAFLQEKLITSVQDVSSLDEYTSELRSGRLEWSPVHKSEKFWRENAVNLNERNYELIKILIRLLETEKDPLILSVAAHDVGEYVRHYPRGKQVLDQLGGKQFVMALLKHEDPNVRYNALISLQKIMVHNWEYLGKQLDNAASQDKDKAAARSK